MQESEYVQHRVSMKRKPLEEEEISDEDDAFWIFTMLVESVLPVDYYCDMIGVITDQKIFYEFFA